MTPVERINEHLVAIETITKKEVGENRSSVAYLQAIKNLSSVKKHITAIKNTLKSRYDVVDSTYRTYATIKLIVMFLEGEVVNENAVEQAIKYAVDHVNTVRENGHEYLLTAFASKKQEPRLTEKLDEDEVRQLIVQLTENKNPITRNALTNHAVQKWADRYSISHIVDVVRRVAANEILVVTDRQRRGVLKEKMDEMIEFIQKHEGESKTIVHKMLQQQFNVNTTAAYAAIREAKNRGIKLGPSIRQHRSRKRKPELEQLEREIKQRIEGKSLTKDERKEILAWAVQRGDELGVNTNTARTLTYAITREFIE